MIIQQKIISFRGLKQSNLESHSPATLRAVSFDLPRSVGKRKETLRESSTFRVEHALKFKRIRESVSVTSYHKTKTNGRDIFEELWQTHDNQGIISFETQDC